MPHPMSRRRFVVSTGRFALLAGLGTPLLQACGGGDDDDSGGSPASLPLARLDRPVTLPDNTASAVASDATTEDGPLTIFTYPDYVNPDTIAAFTELTGAEVVLAAFDTEDKLLSGLANANAGYDLVVGATTLYLPRFVIGNLIQPLNHDLLTNHANVVPTLQDPYYDQGNKYSIPYTVYTTGVAFRRDVVDDTTLDDTNGWDLLWNPAYRGFTGVIDDARETLTLGMYHQGVSDTNTASADVLAAAEAEVAALVAATNPRFDINAYTHIPEGTAHVNQAWSGDMLAALSYLPEGTDADVLGFWAPPRTTVANDFMVIPAQSKRPVLAHAFIDFLISPDGALQNFEWVGYQPATVSPSVDDLINGEYVPAHLRTALVTDRQLSEGYRLDALAPDVQLLWDDAYARIKAG